ncbi:hypothetical protein PG984_011331 [Apiospora sp. TS-2023a]
MFKSQNFALPSAVPANSLVTPHASAATTPLSLGRSSTPEPIEDGQDPDADPNLADYTNHGRFAGEVAGAIDVRAGIPPTTKSHLVPFVNAPLFEPLDLDPPSLVSESAAKQLPSRVDAERLVDIYFQHVDPIEPVLDHTRFLRVVEEAYSGSGARPGAEHDTGLSIMNLVFALSVQRQELISQIKRQEDGNIYFKRAWVLLRLDTVLWEPAGSIELIQCLILMNRYLHCTSHQHKAWMASGLAIRVAQSISCHLPAPSDTESASDRRLKRQLLASCVGLDRCIAWSQGKTMAQFLTPLPNRINPAGASPHDGYCAAHLRREFELHEIGNHIQLAQSQIRNRVAGNLGLPILYKLNEYHVVAVQLDASLNKWADALPTDWKVQNLEAVADRKSRVERYLLHLRLLHTRIFLHQHLLARFYSMKSHAVATPTTRTPSSNLSDRLLRDCSGLCVESAQALVTLIVETLEPGEPLGLLPWWYRVYYLHIAGITFLAAMLTQELYTESVAQAWGSFKLATGTAPPLRLDKKQPLNYINRI